jgi:hypothetical protein
MRISKKQAYQAHPVPSHVYYAPEDPFEPDITQQPQSHIDEDEEEYERIFRCKKCKEIIFESEIEEHECEE